MQLIPHRTSPDLRARVHARLSDRLDTDTDAPLAVGLSGGGDSHALLALTCDWAKAHGRPVLALTVDHGLNPKSKDWTQQAGEMARALGAGWKALQWAEARLGTAVQERARQARHALLADAARGAGASVLLLGHTANDLAENHWMREDGTPVGQLREMSPSPVWPQGRGVNVFRPLLGESRAGLREYLRKEGLGWIDDPANEDPHYSRIRARQALAGSGGETAQVREITPHLIADCGPLADDGVFGFSRTELAASSGQGLAIALLSASGQSVPPRGDRVAALMDKIRSGQDGVAVLSGARIEMRGDTVLIFREAGEQRRQKLSRINLVPHQTMVWDGRFEVTAREAGWQIKSASGHLSRLTDQDRARLSRLPAAARGSAPVFYNEQSEQYVLGGVFADVRGLCGRRYRATVTSLLDETTQEGDLFALWHGETGATVLFSD